MIFFCFLTIFVDFKRALKDFDLSFKMPFFAYYIPENREKGSIYNDWERFKDEYENDESIALTEIDCFQQPALCEIQLEKKPPVIAPIRRSIPVQGVTPSNYNELVNALEVEKQYDRSRLCREFPNEYFTVPLLLYNTTRDIDTACKEALELAKEAPEAYKYLYIQKSSSETIQFISGYHKFQVNKTINNATIRQSVLEYAMLPLDILEMERAEASERRVAFYISDDYKDIIPFERDSLLVAEKAMTGRMTVTDFNDRYSEVYELSEEETPALMMFSQGMKKWMIIPNFAKEYQNVTKLLLDFSKGDFDSQMLFDRDFVKTVNYTPYYVKALTILSIVIIFSFIFSIIRNMYCRKPTKIE